MLYRDMPYGASCPTWRRLRGRGSGAPANLFWQGSTVRNNLPYRGVHNAVQGLVSDLEAAIEYYALGEFNNWLVRGWVAGRVGNTHDCIRWVA